MISYMYYNIVRLIVVLRQNGFFLRASDMLTRRDLYLLSHEIIIFVFSTLNRTIHVFCQFWFTQKSY